MGMSEDEIIKTINVNLDKIKSLCTDDCINKTVVIDPLEYAIKDLLDLYKKEKEIIKIRNANIKLLLEGYSKIAKELNIKSFAINENIVINHVKENYISKDKIKEKIKELEKEYNKYTGYKGLEFSRTGLINSQIRVLKELLEVKDE